MIRRLLAQNFISQSCKLRPLCLIFQIQTLQFAIGNDILPIQRLCQFSSQDFFRYLINAFFHFIFI